MFDTHASLSHHRRRDNRHVARTSVFVVVASTIVGALAFLAPGSAHADPIYSRPTTLCSAAVGNPMFPLDRRGVTVRINQSYTVLAGMPYREAPRPGTVDLSLANSPVIFGPGYDQHVRFDWRNLTTGQSGSVTMTGSVFGETSPIFRNGVVTGPGSVQITAVVTNTGNATLGSSGLVQRGSCTGAPFRVV